MAPRRRRRARPGSDPRSRRRRGPGSHRGRRACTTFASSAARLCRASLTAAGLPSTAITCRPAPGDRRRRVRRRRTGRRRVSASSGTAARTSFGERVGTVGPALEERRGRDAPAAAGRRSRRTSRSRRRSSSSAPMVDDDRAATMRYRVVGYATTSRSPVRAPQRISASLTPSNLAVAEELVDERVRDEARVDRDRVVRPRRRRNAGRPLSMSTRTECGSPRRRARPDRPTSAPASRSLPRRVSASTTMSRRSRALRGRRDVLPLAATAARRPRAGTVA